MEKTEGLSEDQRLIRLSLRKLFHVPVKVCQLVGSFIFTLEPDGELSFSWFGWPAILHFVKLFLCLVVLLLFFNRQEDYIAALGLSKGTDVISIMLVIVVAYCVDYFCSFISIKQRSSFQHYNGELVQGVVDTILENAEMDKGDQFLQAHLGRIEKMKRRIAVCIRSVLTLVAIIFGSASILVLGIGHFIRHFSLGFMATMPFILLFMGPVVLLRISQQAVLSGWLAYILVGLQALNDQCKLVMLSKDTTRLGQLLNNFRKWNGLIDKFNRTFQWWLVAGTLALFVTIVCFMFLFCTWVADAGFAALFAAAPIVVLNGLVVHLLLSIIADINIEVKQGVMTLREIGCCDWVIQDQYLLHKVKMYHLGGAVQPPIISAGNFFTLGRRQFPSTVATIITYLLVLVQFHMGDRDKHGGGGVELFSLLENETKKLFHWYRNNSTN